MNDKQFNKMLEDYKNDKITAMIFNLSYNNTEREQFFKKVVGK
jgi:hypothetical protein